MSSQRSNCTAICRTGKQCSRIQSINSSLCTFHSRPKDKKADTSPELRCTAICVNGNRCARNKCVGFEFCSTHKRTLQQSAKSPSSSGTTSITDSNNTCTHTVHIEDIDGIAYFIDDHGNVFKPEDILQSKLRPTVIAKLVDTKLEWFHIAMA